MTAPTRALAALAAACLMAGCSWGGEEASGGPATEPPTDLELVSRPHFTGGLEVVLQTGRIVYNDDPCGSMDEANRVCDASGDREYLLVGDAGTARIVEARMDPDHGNTDWTATITFSPDSASTVREFRELARASGATVLVLAEAREVLLMAPVPRIEGRQLTYPGLEKSEAWDLVERIAGT